MESITLFFADAKTIIIIIHAMAAAVGLGAATVSDVLFFRFMTDGRLSRSETPVLNTMTRIMWVALGFLFLSGIGLFLSDPVAYTASSKFIVKMLIVLVIALNGLVMTLYLHPRMDKLNFSSNTDAQVKRIAFALGGISIASWYLSFFLGSVRSIPYRTLTGIVMYIVVLFIAIMASQFMYRRYQKRFYKDKQNTVEETSEREIQ